MSRADQELKLIIKQVAKLEGRFLTRLEREGEINAMLSQQVEGVGRIARLDVNDTLWEALFEFAQHRGKQVLANGRAGTEAQASVTPFSQFTEAIARGLHLSENFVGMRE